MADASDCDAFNRAATPEDETHREKETALSQEEEEEQQQQQQHSVLDSVQETAIAQEQPLASAEMEQHSAGSELEVKKQRLLEELESALLPKGKPKDSVQDLPLSVAAAGVAVGPSKGLGLGIEVIDETAVVETLSLPDSASGIGIGIGIGIGKGKKGSANAAAKKDGNKQSGSRRRGKKDALKQHKIGKKTNTEPPITNGNGNGNEKRRYSRKDMEALRFVNVDKQRSFWNAIYACLQPHVASEYDTLWAVAVATTSTNDPGACLPNKKQAPPVLSSVCCENMDGELQLMESSENRSTIDPSCSHSLISEDGCSNLEECSEDDDTDDDYASIQRPAFMVEGEPNFDSGPPEDGWEYLRRVRWEADQIPRVKVAKLDRNKLSKEQSAYMPKIPDITKCPEHLLPSKQWEDVFLAEFSALRANLSCLEGSNAMNSSNLQPVHSSQILGKNFAESASVMNKDVLLQCHSSTSKAIDPAPNSPFKDKDTTLPLENPGSKASIDRTSSSSLTLPLLSSILGMDSVARVSMLRKWISSLEPANTISRNDCMWLFALSASVDAPLDADTSAAFRNLLRKCAGIRAGKAELDEEVVMLNILATISGKYFGQSES